MRIRIVTAIVFGLLLTTLGLSPARAYYWDLTDPSTEWYAARSAVDKSLQFYDGEAWTNLGGVLASAPAIVYAGPDRTHFIAMGVNNRLYHRTLKTGWARMAPDNYYCTDVGASLSPDALSVVVACRGGNAALYAFEFPSDEDYPYLTSYRNLGGVIYGAPSVASLSALGGHNEPRFLVRGGPRTSSNVWQRTYSYGWSALTPMDGSQPQTIMCDRPPAQGESVGVESWGCQSDATTIQIIHNSGLSSHVESITGKGLGVPSLAGGRYAVVSPNGRLYIHDGSAWRSSGANLAPGVSGTSVPQTPLGVVTTQVTGKVGQPVPDVMLRGEGAFTSYRWAWAPGSATGGLTLSEDGVLSGTPTAPVDVNAQVVMRSAGSYVQATVRLLIQP